MWQRAPPMLTVLFGSISCNNNIGVLLLAEKVYDSENLLSFWRGVAGFLFYQLATGGLLGLA